MILNVDPQLHQWDVDRTVEVGGDTDATHIHFANPGDSKAAIMEIGDAVKIPNYLLQTGKNVVAYLVRDGITIGSKIFPVKKRERPENYVYENDHRNYIYQLITDVEEAARKANEAAMWANEEAARANNAADRMDEHADNIHNPHCVTCEQIGAVSHEELQEELEKISPGDGITDEEFDAKVEVAAVGKLQTEGSLLRGEVECISASTAEVILSEVTAEQIGAVSKDQHDADLDNMRAWAEEISIQTDSLREEVNRKIAVPQYELIQSFTLTEETKTVELNGFELDKFALYLTAPIYSTDGGCRVSIYKGEEIVFSQWINTILSKSEAKETSYFGRNENGLSFIGHTAGSYLYVKPGHTEGINPFTEIEFIMSALTFPIGTKFELWGVRRK